jgi:hypothetical protein
MIDISSGESRDQPLNIVGVIVLGKSKRKALNEAAQGFEGALRKFRRPV